MQHYVTFPNVEEYRSKITGLHLNAWHVGGVSIPAQDSLGMNDTNILSFVTLPERMQQRNHPENPKGSAKYGTKMK
jgi:hypothetical protein